MNWQWIAGFYEGEGSIGAYGKCNSLKLRIAQNELEVLIKIQTFMQQFDIYGTITNNKKCSLLNLSPLSVEKFIKAIWPFMHSNYKKQQVIDAFAKANSNRKIQRTYNYETV